MKVSELKTEMDNGKFAAVDRRFERVDRDLEDPRHAMKADGEATRRHFDKQLRQLISSEGETTRRHFGAVARKITSERNLALDRSMATARHAPPPVKPA